VTGNAGNAMAVVEGSNQNLVLGNSLEGGEVGVIVDGSDRNLLSLNKVRGSADGILVAGDANAVAANVVDRSPGGCEGCLGVGIGVLSGAGNVVKANLASRAAADGINVAAAGTLVALNVAVRNGDLGIEAVPGVRDGGGNRASANGNPAQCAGVTCKGAGHRANRHDRHRKRGRRH